VLANGKRSGILAAGPRSRGKQVEDLIHETSDLPILPAVLKRRARDSAHGEERKDAPPLGTSEMSESGALIRRQVGDVCSANERAGRGKSAPAIARNVVDLPAKLAPYQSDDSPSAIVKN